MTTATKTIITGILMTAIVTGCSASPGAAGKRWKTAPQNYNVNSPANMTRGGMTVDAIPSPVNGVVKISKPYQVAGITYYPLKSSKGYTEEGISSWYGPNFHGHKSANGEVYDMMDRTCAHRTLPFNVMVKVENLENGKSTIVRVNDRGPFAKGRIIDLSRKAAEEIDMTKQGTAHVRLTALPVDPAFQKTADGGELGGSELSSSVPIIDPAVTGASTSSSDTPAQSYGEGFYVQAGSFSDPTLARRVLGDVPSKYKSMASINQKATGSYTLHRVIIGPFPDRTKASKAAREIQVNARTNAMVTQNP